MKQWRLSAKQQCDLPHERSEAEPCALAVEFDRVPATVILAGLDVVDERERQRVAHHILSGCRECELALIGSFEVAGALAEIVPSLPPSEVGSRRIKKRARAATAAGSR